MILLITCAEISIAFEPKTCTSWINQNVYNDCVTVQSLESPVFLLILVAIV